ncbi:hypothetical protein DW060_10755 [Leyella stercorea]|uniref:Uncharacterized protein n=1 Tax=Leyella stercorea TaxID=363265 RepID=A0A415GGU4_9BACT|nr:hypothetical protein DW060_10755 [Leyella stercorea]
MSVFITFVKPTPTFTAHLYKFLITFTVTNKKDRMIMGTLSIFAIFRADKMAVEVITKRTARACFNSIQKG